MSLRPDEREQIHARLLRSRPDLLNDGDWEREVSQLEQAIALAAWRSRPMKDRVAALTDALLIWRGPERFPIRWRGP